MPRLAVMIRSRACRAVAPGLPAHLRQQAGAADLQAGPADGDYAGVLLLDEGVTLAPDYVARLQQTLAARPPAGMVTGKMYYAHDRDLIRTAGVLLDPATGARLRRFNRRWDDGTFIDTVAVDAAGTGAALLTRAAWDALGGLDAGCFSAWDDADGGARLRRAGMTVVVEPQAHCWLAAAAGQETDTGKYYYEYRDRLRYWRRWAPADAWPGIVRAVGEEMARLAAVARIAGRAAIADTLLDALRDAGTGAAGLAPAGRIRPLTVQRETVPDLSGPVALLDWEGSDEARYQALFRVTEMLRRRLPEGEIRFVTARPVAPEVALILKRRNLIVTMRGEIAAATVVALCGHAWCQRDNPLAASLPAACVWWADRQGNIVPATTTALAPAAETAIAGAVAVLLKVAR